MTAIEGTHEVRYLPLMKIREEEINMIQGKMLIGGVLVESESGRWLDCINPATEEVIGRIPRGNGG